LSRVLILSGFLGSGKTTILMHIARYLTIGASASGPQTAQPPVVILENEVGETGIDDTLLKGAGYTVKGIFAGCICCTASVSLLESATAILADYNPQWLIIEATGIAHPGPIRDMLSDLVAERPAVCTIVDASRWHRIHLPMATLLDSQLTSADMIVVSKVDLVDEDELDSVVLAVSKINSFAPVVTINALAPGSNNPVWQSITSVSSRQIGDSP
jgi:G3E family GTPase